MSIATPAVHRHPFPRCYRLTKTDEFSSVFGFRRAIRGKLFMLHYQPRPEFVGDARLGLVIGKKYIKSSVLRNLVKRLARERFRLLHAQLLGYDLILRLIAKPGKIERPQISNEIAGLFAKLRPRPTASVQQEIRA